MVRIVICGYMIRMPLAGNVLAFAQYLLGFERLGHSVLYVEESGWPQPCYNPWSRLYSDDPLPGMKAVQQLLASAGSSCPLVYLDRMKERAYGIDLANLDECLVSADLILNLGGVCWIPSFAESHCLALVDMDPMFTQVGKFAHEHLNEYDAHLTYGTNIGRSDCGIPTFGNDWQPTLPPVVPELWRRSDHLSIETPLRFTTIANWSAYGDIQWDGETYGQKDRQFIELLDLPQQTEVTLELAVSGMPSSVAQQFRNAGWNLVDAATVSSSLNAYCSYIRTSMGEFSVAKHGYVRSRSGWISDRTVCYLAAGRPAVVQETGIPSALTDRGGWFQYIDMQGATQSLAAIASNYDVAQQDALRLADEVFSYRRVLPELLERVLTLSVP